jgi:pyrimidine operon attenuation protein/uracil phosphoribosyltransferase
MSTSEKELALSTVVMTREAIEEALNRIAKEIVSANPDTASLALLGILRRGRPLADRLAGIIETLQGTRPKVGSLATTLYRDDLRSSMASVKMGTETHFDFDVDCTTVILVDDVISAGRTVRAALDEVMDYGRPARIQLACLVDRGLRELPIQPDYLGSRISTQSSDHIAVHLKELDNEDIVLLVQSKKTG